MWIAVRVDRVTVRSDVRRAAAAVAASGLLGQARARQIAVFAVMYWSAS